MTLEEQTTRMAAHPEELVADTAWDRALWTELLPHAVGPGGYDNFMTEIEEDRVRAATRCWGAY
ncbi:hypothetical protein [Streptomyces lavendofoliae]|uniref:hypothetical protein n=1 Tax=Streptomyces lavendofoliae TaxID=67314 RepID=UPI003D8C3B88